MELSAAEIDRRWARWRLERNRVGFRTALRIGITLYPAFGLIDFLVAPRAALPLLWGTRLAFAALTLALFPFARSAVFDRHADAFAAIYIWVGSLGISLMTVHLGGLASPYYAGLILTILAAGLLFVWPPRVVVLQNAAIVGSWIVVCEGLAPGAGKGFETFSNLAFLSATALIAGIGQVLAFRTQREQHAQRVRLEQTTSNLERAHAELQRLDEFKSRFFANMTHELRTPLAMVLTPLELMLDGEMGEFTEAQRSAFQTMLKNALKLLKLINDLLDLSRLEESRLKLSVRRHDLVEQLRVLAEQTQVLAQRKKIALSFASTAERLPIWCDAERLERVFVNLLSNAIKFTPPGGHVDVRVSETADAVRVVVADDGPGFAPEKAERLFERFYQVDMAGTRQYGGTGIGLALARELVTLHAGTIDAESDGRSGARFTVVLPKDAPQLRDQAADGPRPTPAPEGDSAADWAVQLSSRDDFRLLDIEEAAERRVVDRDPDEVERPYTVLVVEDNPQIVRLVHTSLRRQFKVLTAPDGLKGLELALRERPTLVVTDLMMPGIDGYELTRRLREDARTRHVPIIMLTARGELESRVKGLEVGVSAYLTKPFSPKELVTSARQLVHASEETAERVLTHRMESLEIVAAGLAHEMNNPLNYARNALARVRLDAEKVLAIAAAARARPVEPAEEAQLAKAADRIRELLGVAESGLRRIGGTVELMSRYGRGGFRRELVPHDAWEAVRAAVGVVHPATGRKVRVDVELAGDGTIECVPEEFHQVVTNLVQNAIEAAPEETGRVLVTGMDAGDAVLLHVKDNGPGIPADLQAKLFTPFFTTKGAGHGMGLGLTITRRVIQSLGGSLQVQSAPGAGAEFVVRIPRRAPGGARAAAGAGGYSAVTGA
jgi:signal transduction histidine kinase